MHGIWENAKFLNGIRDLTATREAGFAKILAQGVVLGKKRYDDRRSGCGAGLRDHYQIYLGAGRLGREMKGTPSFLLLRFLAVFLCGQPPFVS